MNKKKPEIQPKEEKKVEEIKSKPKLIKKEPLHKFKLFGKWDTDIEVRDMGLKDYINLSAVLVPYSAGRNVAKQFHKSKKNIVERLMSKLFVAGHKGKKHWRTSRQNTGKITTAHKIVKKAFEIIEQREKKNPIEVLVRALETGSAKEGIATIEYGGVRYPKAADLAPQRRIDLALRWLTQGAHTAAVAGKHKKTIWTALADEIIATANNDQAKSNCIRKKIELERQSGASR